MVLAKGKKIFLIAAVSLLQISLHADSEAIQRQSTASDTNQTAERKDNSSAAPDLALKQAMHFADLYNWSEAAPFFNRAEQLYRDAGDDRNALRAHLGSLRSRMEQLLLPEISEELGTTLEENPLMQSDKELRLFCLT